MKHTFSSKRAYFLTALMVGLLIGVFGADCKKKPAEKPQEKKVVHAEEKAARPKAEAGEGLVITCHPRDGQKVFGLRQAISVSFSRPINPQDFSFTMNPDPGEWATRWEEDGKYATLEHANPFQAGKKYELELSVKAPSQKLVIHFQAFGRDSVQLVDEEAEKGLLDLDTSWTYRLQALFEPELLPEKYRSPTPIRCGSSVMTEFTELRDRLKPETLEKLKPYLVRPTDPESYFSRRFAGNLKAAADQTQPGSGLLFALEPQRPTEAMALLSHWCRKKTPKYTVWVPGRTTGCPIAEKVEQTIDMYKMWEKFSELMGKEPPSDQNDKDNGGDGTLDIYVLPPSTPLQDQEQPENYNAGLCIGTRGGSVTPSFIIVDGTMDETELGSTLAHELFHAFQNAFDAREDKWWKEASATWSEYFIEKTWYPDEIEYHNERAFESDSHLLKTLTETDGDHEYSIYLYPFYMAKKYGNQIIATIWNDCQQSQSLDAIDTALMGESGGGGGGKSFDESFKKFALMNWDQSTDYEGKETYPEDVDAYTCHGYDQVVEIPKEMPYEKEIELPPLSAKYWRFKNNIRDAKDRDSLPHVLFDLRKFKENEKLTVQAVIFYTQEGRYKYEDWTGKEERSFCINKDDENFERIILVLGNADRQAKLSPELKVYVNDMECDDCYARITRRDYSEHNAWGGNDHLTQIWDKEATVYVSFEPGFFSATPGQYSQLLGLPYGSTIYQGKSLKILDFKARDFTERTSATGVERKEKKGDHAEILMPSIPTFPIKGPNQQPMQFKPYPLLIIYFEAETGKAKYALVPEVEIKFLWDGKDPDNFKVRSLTQGDAAQTIKIEGIGSIKKIFQVKSGDGVEDFNGDGEYSSQNRGSGTSEDTKQTYKWEIHKKKSSNK